MPKGKVVLGDYELNGFIFLGLMIILIFSSIMVGINMQKNYCLINVNIPNRDMINSFCQANGYEEGGWLDSHTCGLNEVMCYKQKGNAHYYDCINWQVNDNEMETD